ncbi:MaoC family dehydratase [Actinomadura bangladeshensis]|uniref:MaoC family dehydratase n=1 Tax=Actinomadura bangladeshensis TaxID=453573 RepID=A0A4R4PEU7_9ACTN|nr:MaoC family dehydratase [Actinomadura bangladeshensis]TDC20357.1 MaoC family dehydratase [Actinomadura bangladeshensis]
MGVNRDAAGFTSSTATRTWSSTDSVVYALGIGCGVDELAFSTDDMRGVEPRAVPTMGVVLAVPGPEIAAAMGDYDRRKLVHGSQTTIVHSAIPAAGTIEYSSTILGVYDKGSGAAVETEIRATDPATGAPVFTNRSVAFIRGDGGWGGDRGPSQPPATPPERKPDHVVTRHVADNQALIYRLSGDRNPLHSNPEFARAAGFERPILHGLCTYGMVGRALLQQVCGGDADAFGELTARFVAPVFPGDDLVISIWATEPGVAVFEGRRDEEQLVIAGRFLTAGPR